MSKMPQVQSADNSAFVQPGCHTPGVALDKPREAPSPRWGGRIIPDDWTPEAVIKHFVSFVSLVVRGWQDESKADRPTVCVRVGACLTVASRCVTGADREELRQLAVTYFREAGERGRAWLAATEPS